MIWFIDWQDRVVNDHFLIRRSSHFREEKRMTLQIRYLSSRLLLILALAAALLAGLVAIQWATSHSNSTHAVLTSVGGDNGGGRHRGVAQFAAVADSVGGDVGGGH